MIAIGGKKRRKEAQIEKKDRRKSRPIKPETTKKLLIAWEKEIEKRKKERECTLGKKKKKKDREGFGC